MISYKVKKLTAMMLSAFSVIASAENFTEVRNVFFPPVPENWSQKIENNAVIYSAPITKKGEEPVSVVKLTYSRSTGGKTAETLIDEFMEVKHCDSKQKIGKEFYMTSCKFAKTDAIFVGEVDNMYSIEVIGTYTHEAKAVVNKYLNDIVKGKRTFKDRSIAEREQGQETVPAVALEDQ